MVHYDKSYFEWQYKLGQLAGRANQFLYREYIEPGYNVVDFGCGGAFLLANMACKEKLGIEINPEARKLAAANQVRTVGSTEEVPDGWADAIISCHALEHTHYPLDELKKLHTKLKQGGRIIFVVPYERKTPYKPGDINQHLYTWSEMNLGNLFTLAGYSVSEVKEIRHRFPPLSLKLRPILGAQVFHFISIIYGHLNRRMTQVRIVAEKK